MKQNGFSTLLFLLLLTELASGQFALFSNPYADHAYIVAASDAPARVKAQTRPEYLCDGTADDVQVQAALDDAAGLAIVYLSGGTFTLSATVTVGLDSDGTTILEGAMLLGSGSDVQTTPDRGTIVIKPAAADAIQVMAQRCVVADLTIKDGGSDTAGSGVRIGYDGSTEFDANKSRIINVGVKAASDYGFYVQQGNLCCFYDCFASGCTEGMRFDDPAGGASNNNAHIVIGGEFRNNTADGINVLTSSDNYFLTTLQANTGHAISLNSSGHTGHLYMEGNVAGGLIFDNSSAVGNEFWIRGDQGAVYENFFTVVPANVVHYIGFNETENELSVGIVDDNTEAFTSQWVDSYVDPGAGRLNYLLTVTESDDVVVFFPQAIALPGGRITIKKVAGSSTGKAWLCPYPEGGAVQVSNTSSNASEEWTITPGVVPTTSDYLVVLNETGGGGGTVGVHAITVVVDNGSGNYTLTAPGSGDSTTSDVVVLDVSASAALDGGVTNSEMDAEQDVITVQHDDNGDWHIVSRYIQ